MKSDWKCYVILNIFKPTEYTAKYMYKTERITLTHRRKGKCLYKIIFVQNKGS